jgi:formylglycine-generating enzyme required for sulfatase activity
MVRTPEHDRFGLGVLVFHLLMEGFHPYKLKYLGAGEPPEIDSRISSGLYPYAPACNGSVAPPPLAVPYDVLPRDVRGLFERCFVDGHRAAAQRPSAREWKEVLRRHLDGFKICGRNPRHEYWGHGTSCPWCERAQILRQDPFPDAPPVRGPARPRAPVPLPVPPASPAPPPPPRQPVPPPFLRRFRVVAALLVLAVLALVGWAVFWNTSPPRATVVAGAIAGFTSVGENAQGYAEYRHEKTGLVFVLLPGGKFRMGSPETEAWRYSDEGPLHEVELSAFLIAKHELTQAVWEKTMGANPSIFKGGKDLPVENISWDDCKTFCEKSGLDFPTEAQSEYACRAGTQTPFSFGETITTEQVNYNGNLPYGSAAEGLYRGKTVPVGSLPANAFGLHEMHGNLKEWCFDVYDAEFYKKPEATKKDPRSEAGSGFRVLRGGSWDVLAGHCRSAGRGLDVRSVRGGYAGFRPAFWPLPTDGLSAAAPDVAPPALIWMSPADGKPVSAGQVTLRGTVTDDSGPCEVRIGGERAAVVGAQWTLNRELSPGERKLEVVARDSRGNEGRFERVLTVVGNASGPEKRGIAGFTFVGMNPQGFAEYWHDKTGQEFVLLPGGKFCMGSPATEPGRGTDEGPVHEVELSPFLIAKYELTQEVWEKVMGTNPSRFNAGKDLPVETISWDDCKTFCDEAGLDFPTEAQWEYAARGRTQTPFSFGPTIITDQVNYDGNHPYGNAPNGTYRQETVTVLTLPANAFGLHEKHGNVWEWCLDVYDAQFYKKPEATKKDPKSEAGSGFRVLRGGSWYDIAGGCRSAYRGRYAASNRGINAGFRPAFSRLAPE